jgi:O-antigen ligase
VSEISSVRAFADRAMSARVNLERIALDILLAVTATIALPFGANRPWSWSLFTALIALALGVWCVHIRRSGGRAPRLAWRLLPPILLFAAAVLWALVQTLPWTPRSWHAPLWVQTATFLGTPYSGRISLDIQSTLDAVMRLAGYGAAFILAWGLALNREHAARIVKIALWSITAYAAYGLLVEFSGSNTVLWFHKWAYLNFVTGPFVNRNNFATYLGFGAVLCEVLLFARLKPAFEPELSRGEIASRILKTLFGKNWYYLAAIAILLTALLLTSSRAGVASTLLGMLAVGAFLVMREASRRSIPLMLVLVSGLVVVTMLSFSGEDVLDRTLATTEGSEERPLVFSLTLGAIGDQFWTGTGLGTFDPAFSMYRNATLQNTWHQAHNVYLETAFELGVPAAAIFFASMAWIGVMCLRGYFIRHRDRNYPLMAAGCIVIAATHSTLDFSLQIPAVAMTFAIVLGVGFAQSFSTERSSD